MKLADRISGALVVGLVVFGLGTPGCGGDSFANATGEEAGLDGPSVDSTSDVVEPEAGADASVDTGEADTASPDGGSDAPSDQGPDDAVGEEVGADVSADVTSDVTADAPEEGATDSSIDVLADVSADSQDDVTPDVTADAPPDVQEAGWDATDFDAFADGGQPCITGMDQPYCASSSEEPWLVPMVCENDSWEPVATEGECNYGCTNGKCNCTAPMGRLLVNVVSGPPQQRLIQDTVTGYSWFYKSGWTGTAAQAEAFCAAVPGGPYRVPWLEEVKTLMAQKLDYDSINAMSPPDITCKAKNADPVLGEGRSQTCWYKGYEDALHMQRYGWYGLITPYWLPVAHTTTTTWVESVFCIKSGDCYQGDARCSGDNTQKCDATGHWQPSETCALGCLNGVCKCQPGDMKCSGTNPCMGYMCQTDGSWTEIQHVCTNTWGCDTATNECSPSSGFQCPGGV